MSYIGQVMLAIAGTQRGHKMPANLRKDRRALCAGHISSMTPRLHPWLGTRDRALRRRVLTALEGFFIGSGSQ